MNSTPSLALLITEVAAMCARIAQLADADLTAGRQPAVGDGVVLSDFTRCEPQSAIGAASEEGKWRRREGEAVTWE